MVLGLFLVAPVARIYQDDKNWQSFRRKRKGLSDSAYEVKRLVVRQSDVGRWEYKAC